MTTTIQLQSTDNIPLTLPELITGISKVRGGYMIYDGKEWAFFPEADLTPEQVEELEDWREELRPGKRAA